MLCQKVFLSVTPSYVPYMTWRALKHFFGGAMGVFTTQTLLSSVGVSRTGPPLVPLPSIGFSRAEKSVMASSGFQADVRALQKVLSARHLVELRAKASLTHALHNQIAGPNS